MTSGATALKIAGVQSSTQSSVWEDEELVEQSDDESFDDEDSTGSGDDEFEGHEREEWR